MDQQPAQPNLSETTQPQQNQPEPVTSQAAPAQVAPPPTPQQPKNRTLPLVIFFLFLGFVLGLGLATWYFQGQIQELKQTANETSATETKKVLIIGTDPTAPPMESVNEAGEVIGYDIDLGNRLAKEMGMTAKVVPIAWDDIFQSLIDKKIDVIISSVTINDERKQKYAFTEPYINAGQVIISRRNDPIATVDKLRGRKISVQKGTTNEKEAYKYTDKNLVISYDEFVVAGSAVSVASSDAMLSDLTLAKGIIEKYDNLKISSDPFTNEYYGVVMRKDDTELQKKVNDALSVLKVNGYLTDLKQKWLE